MLVEDNPSFRQVLKDNLLDLFPSMEIIEASDGVEALQKIDRHHPDLIFMDIRLPGESGLELTGKIKADHPGIIVIVLTSYESPGYREAPPNVRPIISFLKTLLPRMRFLPWSNQLY
jgi:CheY-like chemotaxis protein